MSVFPALVLAAALVPAPHISDAAVGYARLPAPVTIHVTYSGALTPQALQPAVDALKALGAKDARAVVAPSGGEVTATFAPTADPASIAAAVRNAEVPQASVMRAFATARYPNCFAAQQQAMTSAMGIARRRAVLAARLMSVRLGEPLSVTVNPGQTRDRNDACLASANLPLHDETQISGPRAFPSIWVQVTVTFAIQK